MGDWKYSEETERKKREKEAKTQQVSELYLESNFTNVFIHNFALPWICLVVCWSALLQQFLHSHVEH